MTSAGARVPGPSPSGGAARRGLGIAVVACLAGAGLALFAATRVWVVEETARGGGLSAIRTGRTGGELVGWLPALALVALAGGGAFLALRGAWRRAAGVLIVLAGLAVAAGAASGLGRADAPWWPLLTGLGGLLAAAGGALATAHGHRWVALGARYERKGQARTDPVRDAWDALDRGEDPTVT